MTDNTSSEQKQDVSSEQEAIANERMMDGLLQEIAQNGQSPNPAFVRQVMDSIENKYQKKQVAKPPFLGRFASAFAVAASILFAVGVLYIVGSGNSAVKLEKDAARARILVSSPGGILAREGREFALVNGASLRQNDQIEIFSLDAAYIETANESLFEIGSNSKISIDAVATKTSSRSKSTNAALTLKSGILVVDTLNAPPESRIHVKTRRVRFSASRARFTVIENGDFSLLEVEKGSVRVIQSGNKAPVLVRAGGTCLVQANDRVVLNQNPDEKTAAVIAARRGRLPAGNKLYKELQFQLYRKKKVDICLRKIEKGELRPLS